jgi:Mg2+/Co2+ transporter CorB
MLLLVLLEDILEERGITYQWVIPDFHDETIFQVPDGQVGEAVAAVEDALDALNRQLGWTVPLISGGIVVAENFTKFKLEG